MSARITVLQPKLEIPFGVAAPDSFDERNGLEPADDFIVSRDQAGLPKSRFGDLIWDFSAYNPESKTIRLIFSYWTDGDITSVRQALTREMRLILFALIWRRQGASLSVGTLRNYLTVLCGIAVFAEQEQVSIKEILKNELLLTSFSEGGCSGWLFETLCSLLALLVRMNAGIYGFSVISDKAITAMKKKNKLYRSGLKQHPPIPTRIYSHLIEGLQNALSDWATVEKTLLSTIPLCAKDPRAGRALSRQAEISKQLGLEPRTFPHFEELIDEKAAEYFVSKGKTVDLGSLSSLLGEVQLIIKTIIQTFTGMRDDEANSLPYSCLSTSVVNGKDVYIVNGRTTKFVHGLAKRTQWVTNREAHDAIKAAQRMAKVICSVFDETPEAIQNRDADFPLFVSVAYLGFAGTPRRPENRRFAIGTMGHRTYPAHFFLPLEEVDLKELEQIDPHRAWRSEEKFQLGSPWTFTSHQLRRSLALYAQRSGLVSLPSLRRQLKHITEAMSRYYSRGSAYASNFIGENKDHFGLEWQATQHESSALSYLLNVVLTDEALFGGHAAWVKHRVKTNSNIASIDREATIKRFKKGELAYRETIIGGCTNTGTCEKVAIKWLHVDCIRDNCKNLVGNLSKLETVITAQQRMVESLDKQSVEFRTEMEDLNTLIAARVITRAELGVK